MVPIRATGDATGSSGYSNKRQAERIVKVFSGARPPGRGRFTLAGPRSPVSIPHVSMHERTVFQHIRQRIALPAVLLLALLCVGVAGYRILGAPGTTWLDAIYMTTNVLTTTGFREAVRTDGNAPVMVFTIGLLLFGVSIGVYAISVLTAFIVEGDLTEEFRRSRMKKAIEGMSQHCIVCGVGQTGRAVLGELLATRRQVVVVESNEANSAKIEAEYPDVPLLRGDFTDDDVLLRAGIKRASGVVLCVDSDKDALVATVVARQLNPSIRIVARATDERARERLRTAGADGVVSPAMIGGMRLASELVRPTVVSFLDRMLRARDQSMRIEEVDVPEGSVLAGRSIHELDTRRHANLLVLAVRTPQGETLYNPPHEYTVSPGSTLIVMAESHGVESLQREFRTTVAGNALKG
jgi:voltage-gated potassium channel